jgi:hypothetical protein
MAPYHSVVAAAEQIVKSCSNDDSGDEDFENSNPKYGDHSRLAGLYGASLDRLKGVQLDDGDLRQQDALALRLAAKP